MKLNQQTAALALCTLLGVSVFAGCGRSGEFSELQPAVNKIEYTNLNDSESRELLQELLSDAGVADGRIQGFFRRCAGVPAAHAGGRGNKGAFISPAG